MLWQPDQPNGWWPRLSPDGTKVSYGNGISCVKNLEDPDAAATQFFASAPAGQRPWGGFWLAPDLLTFFREVSDSVWQRYEVLFDPAPGAPVALGSPFPASFFDARDGHWAANVPWAETIYDAAPTPAFGGHGVKVAGPYLLQLRADNSLYRWDMRTGTVRSYIPKVAAHEFTINADGWIGYGRSGEAYVITPDGVHHDVTMTPWRTEGVPHVVMTLDGPWVWNATTRPDTGESLVLGRPLGSLAGLVLSMPGEAHLSVVWTGAGQFRLAGCDAVGRMEVHEANKADVWRTLLPACPPFPKKLYFGHFFAFSDRGGYGDSPNYPQNCSVVVEPSAAVRAARLMPVIVTPNCIASLRDARLLPQVLALYVASEEAGGGATVAERLAVETRQQWVAFSGSSQPIPPVLWYVTPGEAEMPDWHVPPSVGIVAPEFYYGSRANPGDYSAGFDRMRELLWRKMGFWIAKLGTSKPWMPIFQAFDRSRPDVDMKALAAMQPLFLRQLVDIDSRIGLVPPAVGALFFAVNRPGGTRTYPALAAWHDAMRRALPPGVPDIRSTGDSTMIPKVTIASYSPERGPAPLRVRAVAEREEGSGPIDRYVWLYRAQGTLAWTIAANNDVGDSDHTYTLQAGLWEIALQARGPGGVAQTQKRRIVNVSSGQVEPPPPSTRPSYEEFVNVEAPAVAVAFKASRNRNPSPNDLAHFAWRRLVEGWAHAAILADIKGEGPSDDPPKPPPPPVGTVKSLQVRGRLLVDSDGAIFRPRFVGGFALPSKPDRVEHYLDWARATGFNGVRVMAGALTWAGQTPETARMNLPKILRDAMARGLYVEVTALTDSGTGYDVEEHVARVADICAGQPHVLVEVANEPYHATQAARVHDFSFLEHLGRTYLDPHGLIWAAGAPESDEPEEPLPGGYITLHLDRGRDPWNMVRRVREMEVAQQRYKRFVMNGEPIGFADTDQPGRRVADPQIAFTMGVLSRAFEVGVVSHADHCLQADLPSPQQQLCHDALVAGFTCLPTGAELVYKNAGWGDSPIKGANFSRDDGHVGTIVRAYSFMDSASHGFTVLLGLSGDPQVEWQNGFESRRTLEDRGGVRVLDVAK